MVSKLRTGIEMQQARRSMLRIGAGGLLALGLVACGGGGGDGDSDDVDLRAAYDRVLEGMTIDQVIKAVGREPRSTSNGSGGIGVLRFSNNSGSQALDVGIGDSTRTTTYVRYDSLVAPFESLRKNFD